MEIRKEIKFDASVKTFLEEHLSDMRSTSPPESVHALDMATLKKPDIEFWTMWQDKTLVGCGALKIFEPRHGEIKSMRIASMYRGKGFSSILLQYILDEAKNHGLLHVSLETGSIDYFKPARALYRKYGFSECPPFDTYKKDPFSLFMTKRLPHTSPQIP